MVKQSVKVVIRTRPTSNFASKNLQVDPTNSVSFSFLTLSQTVAVTIPKNEAGGFINNQLENWKFKFDKLLHNAS